MIYTTKVKTRAGVEYDLGKFEHPPQHKHGGMSCDGCLVINAWTEPKPDVSGGRSTAF